jgi:hypothetical protein
MYIFLFVIGAILIAANIKALKKEKLSFKNSLDIAATEVTDFDIKLTEVRREFAETITELQGEILDLKLRIEALNNSKEKGLSKYSIQRENISENIKENNFYSEEFQNNNETNTIDLNYNNNAVVLEEKANLHMDNISFNDTINISEDPIDSPQTLEKQHEKEKVNSSNNLKVEDVKALFAEGSSVEEVAAKLNIGKGEVLLIRELYLK